MAGEESRVERTRSESSLDMDTAMLRQQATEEARRILLLEQLNDSIKGLTSKLTTVSDDINHMKRQMDGGEDRMGRIERDVKGLREEMALSKREFAKAADLAELEDDFKAHTKWHQEETNRKVGAWSGVVPGIITSVLASILTAAIVGGIIWANSPKSQQTAAAAP